MVKPNGSPPLAVPFHILMLPAGVTGKETGRQCSGINDDAKIEGRDYVERRYRYWQSKKGAETARSNISVRVGVAARNRPSRRGRVTKMTDTTNVALRLNEWKTPEKNALISDEKVRSSKAGHDLVDHKKIAEEGDEDDEHDQKVMASIHPLEMEILNCCELDTNDDENDVSQEDSKKAHVNLNSRAIFEEKVAKPNRCRGRLKEGKEGQFASLIARHCYSVEEQSLALSVIERTMILNQSQQLDCAVEANRQPSELLKSLDLFPQPSFANNNDGAVQDKNLNIVATECNSGAVASSRIKNFLSAGGLKVLNQWLLDSFTPATVLAAETQQQQVKARRNRALDNLNSPRKRQSNTDNDFDTMTTTASPTGPIILPLLKVLQFIPFSMELVKETQINKQIRKLKKALDKVISNFIEELQEKNDNNSDHSGDEEDEEILRRSRSLVLHKHLNKPKEEALTELRHPVAGGMLVKEVLNEVENLMNIWKCAAAASAEKKKLSNKTKKSKNAEKLAVNLSSLTDEPDASVVDIYADLRFLMQSQYPVLALYESGNGDKPPWLEKIDGEFSAVNATTVQSQRRPFADLLAAQSRQDEQSRKALDAKRKIEAQEAKLKAAQDARLEAKQKMNMYKTKRKEDQITTKRKAEELEVARVVEMEEQQQLKRKKAVSMRKVSWIDQQIVVNGDGGNIPLTEVRIFVKDADVFQTEEEEKKTHETVLSNSEWDDNDASATESASDETNSQDKGQEDMTDWSFTSDSVTKIEEDPNLSAKGDPDTGRGGNEPKSKMGFTEVRNLIAELDAFDGWDEVEMLS